MLKIAIIGLGNRGRIYLGQFRRRHDVEVVALCEKNKEILESKREKTGIKKEFAFSSDAEFFAAGKLADALVITTQDRDHYGHAIKALDLGYDILLEKPVSPVRQECEDIARKAAEKNLKVVVCHVLRYSGFLRQYQKSDRFGRDRRNSDDKQHRKYSLLALQPQLRPRQLEERSSFGPFDFDKMLSRPRYDLLPDREKSLDGFK